MLVLYICASDLALTHAHAHRAKKVFAICLKVQDTTPEPVCEEVSNNVKYTDSKGNKNPLVPILDGNFAKSSSQSSSNSSGEEAFAK